MPIDAARIPAGKRLYAVGDIHGRIDLLTEIEQMIVADAATASDAELTVVYLGDYVDRGSHSFAVVDRLVHAPLPGFTAVHLRGNHEEMMHSFLDGEPEPLWLMNGGIATLESYGVAFDWGDLDRPMLQSLQQRLNAAMPDSHRQFLDRLALTFRCGDYAFVHAGVRPGLPLDMQLPRDLLWIRAPFLRSEEDFGKRVVHGHTIVGRPEVKANRIGIDTGAFHSGRLTCLVLEMETIRFLST